MEREGTYIYPALGARHDLGYVRLSGVGLGNAFFSYFHAVRHAERSQARVIEPAWPSLKLGTLLRRERSKRLYGSLFKPHPTEIAGGAKAATLTRALTRRHVVDVCQPFPSFSPGCTNVCHVSRFTFDGLHEHRHSIRERLLTIYKAAGTRSVLPRGAIAVHVRLGDFATPSSTNDVETSTNVRIPFEWYISAIEQVIRTFGGSHVYVFSDAFEDELSPILSMGATVFRGQDDLDDLLAMSSASFLIGSNSTFSSWAAFLGDTPSLWLQRSPSGARPTSPESPLGYLSLEQGSAIDWRKADAI